MLEIIRQNPWTGPLDYTLHSTRIGEVRYPFASFVRLPQTRASEALFPDFARLPAELQLHIVSFCDRATLFQLMRTNSFLRTEACKLFWSNTEAWYFIDARWILSGGFPGDGDHTMDVLPHVKQLEVDFENLEDMWGSRWEMDFDAEPDAPGMRHLEERVSAFWRVLREKFPQVSRVVLSESIGGASEPRVRVEMKTLRRLCPSDVTALVSVLWVPELEELSRTLWTMVQNDDGAVTWEVVSPLWSRTSVLLPLKEFHGPVGEYCHAEYQSHCFNARSFMAALILLEAIERQHFKGRHEPFACFEPYCEARFEAHREWTNHALFSLHYEDVDPPEDLMAACQENERELKNMQMTQPEKWKKMWAKWGHEGSEQRRRAKQAFLDQLGSDALYKTAKAPEECALWAVYKWRIGEWGTSLSTMV